MVDSPKTGTEKWQLSGPASGGPTSEEAKYRPPHSASPVKKPHQQPKHHCLERLTTVCRDFLKAHSPAIAAFPAASPDTFACKRQLHSRPFLTP